MVKVGSQLRPRRNKRLPKTPVGWLVTCLLGLPVAVLFLGALASLTAGASYLGYLASKATVFDTWGALHIVSTVLALIAVVGTVIAAWRLRMGAALFFAALALPATFVIEGSRCDTPAGCQATGWAALPPGAFDWQVRIRPVTTQNDAWNIAFDALLDANVDDSPFIAKRFGDHWIVSTIDDDGWPGAQAVRIETRTARTAFVPCPEDRIQCGMERPTVSDGQRVYRNVQLGLSAVFPASLPVCTTRDDDGEPLGFHAMVRAPDIPCEDLDQSRELGIGVVRWRRNGCTDLEDPSVPWRPLTPETSKLFRGQRLTLGGVPALACEVREGDHIGIIVYASLGSGSDLAESYAGYIGTTPAHLIEDIRAFEIFLQNVRLGPAAREQTG
ncbi:MAG: hypothetical protein Q8S53_00805 [Brevundimonas sp.]|uniref:hypothetical protein n=1 Tax=Brevundimonas sp. TaxID=1871086 RepID=UPI002733D9B0|nr:hypothetical protein [Brevundimonas sp.]MDP3376877.1 hypothetical protein [Brevundimonas sp.]